MRGLITYDEGTTSAPLNRVSLSETERGFNEDWLQRLMHANPCLIPLDEIAPGSGAYIPVCRELSIPKLGGSVFLDLFGVTPTGRLVLIECKLWRNPQARREVVAQALEYAALIRAWSYADLTARLKPKLKSQAPNPLYDLVKDQAGALGEAAFVDRVTQSLKLGDFIILIAGDGIRSDVQAMAAHLNASASAAVFSLLEIQLWQGGEDQLIVLPAVPLTTQVLKQRVIVSADGAPLEVEPPAEDENEVEARIDPKGASDRQSRKRFWQVFIDKAVFDHAEQPAPRHGGDNYVRLAMPEPIGSLVAYRTKAGEAGIFFRAKGHEGEGLFKDLQARADHLAAEIGLAPAFAANDEQAFDGTVSFLYPDSVTSDDALLAWLLGTANKVTSSLRTFLAQY